MRDRWGDGVMLVTEMGTVWCGSDVVLGLEQVLKDPGLRPVAQTRTKTGLT